jgi:hypothetical protein
MPRIARGAALLGAALLVSGCVAAPESQSQLSSGGSLVTESEHGLAEGRLRVLGELVAGSNDFELTLTTPNTRDIAALDGLDAVRPAHGHRAEPSRIEPGDGGYRIVALSLPMSGVWRLTGSLSVDGVADEIAFDVDVP